jgi:hypothetical protein
VNPTLVGKVLEALEVLMTVMLELGSVAHVRQEAYRFDELQLH